MVTRQYYVAHSEDLMEFEGICKKLLNERWEFAGGLAIRDREFLQSFYRETETVHPVIKKKKRSKPAKRPKKDPT